MVGKLKQQIFDNSSIYQIGGQANHCIEEHIFSIKSIMSLAEHTGKGVILTLVDIVAFFDRENILDVMETLENMNVDEKAARLWYKLNEKTEIQVKTAVGMTRTAKVGALVGQGSTGAAVMSQAMVDNGLRQYFEGSSDEMYYGKVRVEAAEYQDDILKPSKDIRTAQVGMTKLAEMLKERGLKAHEVKTGFIIVGSKAFKEEVERGIKQRPLLFGEFAVKRKVSDKYLGQILHEDGLRSSVEATIKERTGKIKGAIYLTAQIVDSFQMQAMGGLMAAKVLWEGAIVPSLLSGAATWMGITSKEEEMCEELQELFWRTVLQVPRGGPKVMLRAETGSLKMKKRIQKQKLMLAKKISKEKKSLAKVIYAEQVEMGWPGLAKEAAEICKEIGLRNLNEKEVTKKEIEEAIFYSNYKEMKAEIEMCDKLAAIKNENFSKEQEYMKEKAIEKARTAYRIRTKMVQRVKMNYKNMYKGNLGCDYCKAEFETQEHVMECDRWKEERGSLDMYRMSDMVQFFINVLKEKEK